MLEKAIVDYLKKHEFDSFNLRSVLFDMDGVLFDSMPAHAASWKIALHERGIPSKLKDVYILEGSIAKYTVDYFYKKTFDKEATDEEVKDIYQLKTYYFNIINEKIPMPYALEMLRYIKESGLVPGVVTGSAKTDLLPGIEERFQGIFSKERIVTANDVTQGKPYPEPYLMGLEKTGCRESNQAIVIENAPLGIRSASSAGIFVIGLNTGMLDKQDLYDAGANYVLNSMKELYEQKEMIFDCLNRVQR